MRDELWNRNRIVATLFRTSERVVSTIDAFDLDPTGCLGY